MLVGFNCGRHGTKKRVSMIGKSLDLLENPGLVFAGVLHLYHAGIARIALFTKNVEEEYARLSAEGVEIVSEPVTIRFAGGAGAKFFCFKDPDGTFLELIEPFNG